MTRSTSVSVSNAVHGVVCSTGKLSNQWTVADFYPIDCIPSGVRLTAYGGDAADLPTDVADAAPATPTGAREVTDNKAVSAPLAPGMTTTEHFCDQRRVR